MYKLFIVEDEHLIRDNLRHQVSELSTKYPITYIGEAADGEMALASIIDLQPDILLTDIKMPFMDGLSFAKEARKLLPWTRIIFISGFDDFVYTKGAIQVQADDYLLKPIKNRELESAIEKAVAALNQKKQEEPQSKTDLIAELKKNHFLNGLFKGELAVDEAFTLAESFKRSFAGKKFAVLLATNQFTTDFEDYAHFSDYLNFLFRENPQVLFSSVSSHFIKFLIFDTHPDVVLETSYQIAQTLIHELTTHKNELTAAISPIIDRISELPDAFEITQHLLTGPYPSKERIISCEDITQKGGLLSTSLVPFDFLSALDKLTKKEIPSLIAQLVKPQHSEKRTHLYRYFILTELFHLAQKKSVDIPFDLILYASTSRRLTVASEREEYEKALHTLISYLIVNKIRPSMTKYRNVINHALDFIKDNFTDPDMSLNMVAQEVALSPSHFSTVFSQSLDQTFIDYLTEQRVERAKELLEQTNQRLSDIAFEIGYNDPNYFSYLFKKKQGVSPKEYRRSVTEKETPGL